MLNSKPCDSATATMTINENPDNLRKSKRKRPLHPTIRFNLQLEKPSSETFTEYNYNKLVLKTLKYMHKKVPLSTAADSDSTTKTVMNTDLDIIDMDFKLETSRIPELIRFFNKKIVLSKAYKKNFNEQNGNNQDNDDDENSKTDMDKDGDGEEGDEDEDDEEEDLRSVISVSSGDETLEDHQMDVEGENGDLSEEIDDDDDDDDDLDDDDDDDDDDSDESEVEVDTNSNTYDYGQFKPQDFAHLGTGYDLDDSFIDNTDVMDERLPGHLQPKHGGFYINKEQNLQLVDKKKTSKKVNVPNKRPNKITNDSNSNSSSSGVANGETHQAKTKPNAKKKAVRRLSSSSDNNSIGEKPQKKTKTDQTEPIQSCIVQPSQQSAASQHVTPMTQTMSVPQSQPIKDKQQIRKAVVVPVEIKTSIEQKPVVTVQNPTTNKPSEISSIAVPNKQQQVPKQTDTTKMTPTNAVLSSELTSLMKNLENILQKTKTSESFWNNEAKSIMLNIHKQLNTTHKNEKSEILSYISQRLNMSKTALARRCKRLQDKENAMHIKNSLTDSLDTAIKDKLNNFIQIYKQTYSTSGPANASNELTFELKNLLISIETSLTQVYEKDENFTIIKQTVYESLCTSVNFSQFHFSNILQKAHVEFIENQISNSLINFRFKLDNELKQQEAKYNSLYAEFIKANINENNSGVPGKKVHGPRKKFQWPKDLKELFFKIVQLNVNLFNKKHSNLVSSQSLTVHIKDYLVNNVLVLWSKGWMQIDSLMFECVQFNPALFKWPLAAQNTELKLAVAPPNETTPQKNATQPIANKLPFTSAAAAAVVAKSKEQLVKQQQQSNNPTVTKPVQQQSNSITAKPIHQQQQMKQTTQVVHPFSQQQQQQQQKSPFKTPTKIIESHQQQQQQHKSPLLNLTKNFAHAHNNHNSSAISTINKSGILQTLNNSKNMQHESPNSLNFKQSSPQRLASPQASLSQHWSNNNNNNSNNNNNNNNNSSVQRQISIQNILEEYYQNVSNHNIESTSLKSNKNK